ncbi:hypothetical protein RF11_01243 [Thelohanellus kitauei]|uniref:Uncharacterized protein n=1 Tax=Thelohanellus kitauei TaxID=669202 RepID=A0A0C2N5L9_THEKT|nr:hypothetical protein RF11_01243 [Thelohanellus kitauei]
MNFSIIYVSKQCSTSACVDGNYHKQAVVKVNKHAVAEFSKLPKVRSLENIKKFTLNLGWQIPGVNIQRYVETGPKSRVNYTRVDSILLIMLLTLVCTEKSSTKFIKEKYFWDIWKKSICLS